jgi:hypothetical protein
MGKSGAIGAFRNRDEYFETGAWNPEATSERLRPNPEDLWWMLICRQ